VVAAVLIVWFVAGSAWSFFHDGKMLRHSIRWQRAQARQTGSPVDQEVQLLKKVIPPHARILVLSSRDALFHLHLGVPTLAPCSVSQMLLVTDHLRLCDALDREPQTPVYAEYPSEDEVMLSEAYNLGLRRLGALLRAKYRVTARLERGCLYERVELPGLSASGLPTVPPAH
jgi:hypothetical protein